MDDAVVAEGWVVKTSLLAVPAEMVNAGEVVVAVRVPLAAVKTLFVPTRSIFRPFPVKSATPATAFMLTVPPRVPAPVVKLKVTDAVEVVIVFPAASSMVTTGWVANAVDEAVVAEG